jgi:hypothetical protein
VFDATYNIINIQDGKIEMDIKIIGGKRIALSDIVQKYEPNFGPQAREYPDLTKNSLI